MNINGRIVMVLLSKCVLSSICWSTIPFQRDNNNYTLSLNNQWKYSLIDQSQSNLIESFYRPTFDDSQWDNITVPSNSQLQGFEEPHYYDPDYSKIELYRKTVTLPPGWKGRQVLVHFEGISFGYTLYLNGRKLGSFQHAFLPCQFDLTRYIRYDTPNVLALKLYRNHDELHFDRNDDWALSGIYRDAFLFSPSRYHIADYSTETKLNIPRQSATIEGTVDVKIFRGRGNRQKESLQPLSLKLELRDMEGHLIAEQTEAIRWLTAPLVPTHRFSIPLEKAVFWNAEHPYLYALTIKLLEAGKTLQTVEQKVGMRQVSIDQGILKINGQPIKLRGVCRHELHPDVGRALREEHWLEDIKLMKAANINAVRCSHYPPHSRFLELCDQFGLYVLDEVPIGFGVEHQNDPIMLGAMLSRAALTVARDRNHPSVIIWDIGNEGPLLKLLEATARYVKQMDPSRPILYPGENFNQKYEQEATGHADWVDIFAPHYPSNERIHRDINNASLKVPIIYTEINHSLDTAFGDYAAKWEMIESSEKTAGAMIWLWADQGVKRKINGRLVIDSYADPDALRGRHSALSGDVYADENTILDSHGIHGTDGIVYADRKPQTDYFQTRKIYSPVMVKSSEMTLNAEGMVSLAIDNRYDFTNLNEISGQWKLLINGKSFKEGRLALDCLPHKSQMVLIPIDLPKIAPSDTMLQLSFTDYKGVNIYERTLTFRDAPIDWGNEIQRRAKPMGVLRKEDKIWKLGDYRVGFNEIGLLSIYEETGTPVLIGPWARVGRPATMAERSTYKKMRLAFWETPMLRDIKILNKYVEIKNNAIVIEMQVQYLNPQIEKQSVTAMLTYVIDPCGWVDVQYQLKPDSTEGALLEFGMTWDIPQVASVSWLGDGPYPAYPRKDQLVERGIYQFALEDRFFDGNRTNVELTNLINKGGQSLAVITHPANVGWQKGNASGQAILYLNNRVADFGTKFDPPRSLIKADSVGTVSGTVRFVLPSTIQRKFLQDFLIRN